jgi:hypothetical protein
MSANDHPFNSLESNAENPIGIWGSELLIYRPETSFLQGLNSRSWHEFHLLAHLQRIPQASL